MTTTAYVLALYRGAPLTVRAHVRVRWVTCPFRAVAAQVPLTGRVLEVGCGHGLLSTFLALESPGRTVVGIDVDARKLGPARAAADRACRLGAHCSIEAAPPGHLPDGPWDAVAIVDVLYLLPVEVQRRLLLDCAARLAPGGTLLVKEMATAPRWKAQWNRAQETLAVKVLGITEGDSLSFLPPAETAGWLHDAGLAVRHLPLHRGYPHPHHLLVAKSP